MESIDRMVLGELLHQGIQFAARSPVIAHDQDMRFPVSPIRIGFVQGSKALGELFFRKDPLVSPNLISGFPRPCFLGRAPCNDQGHFMKVLLGLFAKRESPVNRRPWIDVTTNPTEALVSLRPNRRKLRQKQWQAKEGRE